MTYVMTTINPTEILILLSILKIKLIVFESALIIDAHQKRSLNNVGIKSKLPNRGPYFC